MRVRALRPRALRFTAFAALDRCVCVCGRHAARLRRRIAVYPRYNWISSNRYIWISPIDISLIYLSPGYIYAFRNVCSWLKRKKRNESFFLSNVRFLFRKCADFHTKLQAMRWVLNATAKPLTMRWKLTSIFYCAGSI